MNEAYINSNSKRGRPPCKEIKMVISNINITCSPKRKCSRITSDFFRSFLINVLLYIRSENNRHQFSLSEIDYNKLISITETNHQQRAKSIRRLLSTIPNIATSIENKFVEDGNLMGVFQKMFVFTYIGNPQSMELTALTMLRIFTKKIQKDYDELEKKSFPGKCCKRKKCQEDCEEESFDAGYYLNLSEEPNLTIQSTLSE